jgi:hypothetical protein
MSTWTDSLFYIAFLGQIYLISWYFPDKILGRMKYVLETYPRSAYPKLYPKPAEYYVIGQWAFKVANRVIVGLGLGILFAVMFLVDHASFADDGFISEAWPAAYGVIQFVPLSLLELSVFRQFRLMRKANTASTRQADLHRRRLFDFVSPAIVGLTATLFFAALIIDLYVHDFVIAWGHDTVQRAIVLAGTNLFFVAVGTWILHGRKQDPHQTSADRSRQIASSLRSIFYTSTAMSVFFITQAADDAYDLDYLNATLVSLYFQAIVFLSIGHILRSLKLEEVDFEVYKSHVAAG